MEDRGKKAPVTPVIAGQDKRPQMIFSNRPVAVISYSLLDYFVSAKIEQKVIFFLTNGTEVTKLTQLLAF